MRIQLEFHIEPLPKERPRFTNRGGFARAYTSSKTRNFEASIARMAKAQLQFQKPITDLIVVSVFFEFMRPKKTVLMTPKKDLDNLCKSIFDALNGILYNDDTQIIELMARKTWSDKNKITVVINEIIKNVRP